MFLLVYESTEWKRLLYGYMVRSDKMLSSFSFRNYVAVAWELDLCLMDDNGVVPRPVLHGSLGVEYSSS